MKNIYEDTLQFRGTWRDYQDRVLSNADKYLADGKVHIVAAPGSGKTTLGIELIRRLGAPCLILSPGITIRQQWLERIVEGFLLPGRDPEELLSNDLKNMKTITAITYQALYSAMKHNSAKDELATIMQHLREYTASHFSTEEQLFEHSAYPHTREHKEVHRRFVAKLEEFESQIKNGTTTVSMDLLAFLKDWLINHIQGTDPGYVSYLKGHGRNR